MKFKIERASTMFCEEDKPIPNAELIGKDKWGQNVWTIEIDTLEDLLALKTKVAHSLILESVDEGVEDLDNEIKHSILIYDDYIE